MRSVRSGGPWSAWRGRTVNGQSSGVAPSVSQHSWSPSMESAKGRNPPGSVGLHVPLGPRCERVPVLVEGDIEAQPATPGTGPVPLHQSYVLAGQTRAQPLVDPVPVVLTEHGYLRRRDERDQSFQPAARGERRPLLSGWFRSPRRRCPRGVVQVGLHAASGGLWGHAVGHELGQRRHERRREAPPGVAARVLGVLTVHDDWPLVGVLGCCGVPIEGVGGTGGAERKDAGGTTQRTDVDREGAYSTPKPPRSRSGGALVEAEQADQVGRRQHGGLPGRAAG